MMMGLDDLNKARERMDRIKIELFDLSATKGEIEIKIKTLSIEFAKLKEAVAV